MARLKQQAIIEEPEPIPVEAVVHLGCVRCDREVYLQTHRIPRAWKQVEQVQTRDEAVATESTVFNCRTFSLLDWQTHMGICPECVGK